MASTSRWSRCKLYTRPEPPVPVYVATAGPVNAKRTGRFADGMITVGAADEKIRMLWGKCDEGCREAGQGPGSGRPSCSRSTSAGPARTTRPWTRRSANGRTGACRFPSRTSRTPRTSRPWRGPARGLPNRVLMTSDLRAHIAHVQHYVDMGFDEVHLHNVGRNQAEFIEGLRQGGPAGAAPGRLSGRGHQPWPMTPPAMFERPADRTAELRRPSRRGPLPGGRARSGP